MATAFGAAGWAPSPRPSPRSAWCMGCAELPGTRVPWLWPSGRPPGSPCVGGGRNRRTTTCGGS
eukprot:4962858-Alexandrium_andersonii.AAC.1